MILLSGTNSYGYLQAIIEDDGRSVYLYLQHAENPDWGMRALWIANRVAAPAELDVAGMQRGETPLMPRPGTRQPDGLPPFRPEDLSIVWFEEGDGLAVLWRTSLWRSCPRGPAVVAVTAMLPSAVGQTPLAWELCSEALGEARAQDRDIAALLGMAGRAGLLELIRARRWPTWRRGWDPTGAIGPRTTASSHRAPSFCSSRPTSRERRCTSPSAWSAQAMPQVEVHFEDPAPLRRTELVIATAGHEDRAPRTLSSAMCTPWRDCTWLGDGHTWSFDPSDPPEPWPSAFLLLAQPPSDRLGVAPDLSGLTAWNGDPVNYLWLLPISAADQDFAEAHSSDQLASNLAESGRGWLWDPT